MADEEEGGVLGREELEFLVYQRQRKVLSPRHKDNSAYKESNLSISAWEYAAPTTRPDPWPVGDAIFLLDEELRLSRGGGLQKGDADLVEEASAREPRVYKPRQIIHTLIDLFNIDWACISKYSSL